MDFWNQTRNDDEPTDRLERDPLSLSVEDAQAEYFADMAFDHRLIALFENKAHATTTIDITHTSDGCTDGLSLQYFAPNTTIENAHTLAVDDAYAYRLSGVLSLDQDKLTIDARVDSELGDYPSVSIQSEASRLDCFYLSKIGDEFNLSIIDTKELFTVLCRLAGARDDKINTYMDEIESTAKDNPLAFQVNIVELWNQIGETHGKTKTVREVIHKIVEPTDPALPEKIKLRYEEFENPDATIIKLFLEHCTEMTELDAQESYCLSLKFEQINNKSAHSKAKKVIVSGISPKLIGLNVHKKSQGSVTPLDINDPVVKGLFVNWFDEIVTAV